MGFIPLKFIDVIDILLVASLFYGAYPAMKGTSAPYIMIGIFVIYLVWILVKTFNLVLFSSILGQIISVGVIAILIIFQPEIRHFLQAIGRQRGRFEWLSRIFNFRNRRTEQDINLDPIVLACEEMGAEKVGALIIIKQDDDLGVVVESGISIDAKVSTPLLENIFFKNAPLHDGAMVIDGGRIVAAKCILPVTQSDVPKDFGTRHRAAIGLSELTDAVVIVVSEETGGISIVKNGQIKHNIDPLKFGGALKRALGQKNQ
jgi:uncharacterized protein (TIGR00159 family)